MPRPPLQVFFLRSEDHPGPGGGLGDPADHSRLTENVARAFCTALGPHLKLLKEDGMAKLGLRVTLDTDQVGEGGGDDARGGVGTPGGVWELCRTMH